MDSCLYVPLLWTILGTTRALRQVHAGRSLSGVRTSHTCYGVLMCAAGVDVKAATGNMSWCFPLRTTSSWDAVCECMGEWE